MAADGAVVHRCRADPVGALFGHLERAAGTRGSTAWLYAFGGPAGLGRAPGLCMALGPAAGLIGARPKTPPSLVAAVLAQRSGMISVHGCRVCDRRSPDLLLRQI